MSYLNAANHYNFFPSSHYLYGLLIYSLHEHRPKIMRMRWSNDAKIHHAWVTDWCQKKKLLKCINNCDGTFSHHYDFRNQNIYESDENLSAYCDRSVRFQYSHLQVIFESYFIRHTIISHFVNSCTTKNEEREDNRWWWRIQMRFKIMRINLYKNDDCIYCCRHMFP